MKLQLRFAHGALLGRRVQCNTLHSRRGSDISYKSTLALSHRLTYQNNTSESSALYSNWHTIKDQPLTSSSLHSLFSNNIASIRHRNLLSSQECQYLVDVVNTHRMGSYNKDVYPPIGAIGISQFDHQKNKEGYFKQVADARQLQARFTNETGIDIVSRVAKLVAEVSGLPVRIAQEDDRKYFAGLLRMINSSALLHADFAPYDGPEWEIGRITSQITWNVLLSHVQGGESVIYDRLWRGEQDEKTFKKAYPSYGYSPLAVENHAFKVLQPVLGDLTFFNSRNFHEVKLIDRPEVETRFTMSSFMGYLDSTAGGPTIIMWS